MILPLTDPILVFTIIIGMILLLPLLAQRLRIPDTVLLLLAGALAGPHVSGLLERSSAITLFGSVGILYIMFLAGLEVDLHRFRQVRNRSLGFGIVTFLIPQVLGTLAALFILKLDWPQALLLASLFASHTLLAYPVASRLGLAKTEPVVVTIGATLVADVCSLLILAVIADSAKGASLDFGFWMSLTAGLAVLVAIAQWVIPWFAKWFFRHTQEDGIAQFLFVLGTMTGFGLLFHLAHMEPIIGAFFAGVSFNRLIPERGTLMNRLEFMGKTLFIPFFLISVGMLVNPMALISSPESWLTVGVMVGMVILTKYLAAAGFAKLVGYSKEEAGVMFGLTVVHVAATLAAVLVGYELKIFDDKILNGAIAMIMITSPMGSWVVENYGKKMILKNPEPNISAQTLGQRILVTISNPRSAPLLTELSISLRDEKLPGVIHAITVVSPQPGNTEEAVARGENLLATSISHAASAEISLKPSVHIDLNVTDGIVRAAQEYRATSVIVGWGFDRTVASRLFGTIFEKLLEDSGPRVFLARLVNPLNLTRRIVLPLPPMATQRTDFGEITHEVELLARRLGTEILILASGECVDVARVLEKNLQSQLPCTVEEFPEWTQIRSYLFRQVKKDDMVFLPVERRQGVYWFPSLDKIPEQLAEKQKNVNILAVYPSLRDQQSAKVEEDDYTHCPPIFSTTWEKDISLFKGISKLLERLRFRTEAELTKVRSALLESASSFPVEMAPGIVLLHTHNNIVKEPTILIGLGEEGFNFPNLIVPVTRVICLISPLELEPHRHLGVLADLARTFRKGDITKELLQVGNAESAEILLRMNLVKVKKPKSQG